MIKSASPKAIAPNWVHFALSRQAIRFLIAGTFAAWVNWVARIAISLVLPYEISILLAYSIGMLTGYLLYQRFVFVDRTAGRPKSQSIGVFLSVNIVSAVLVLGLSLLFLRGFAIFWPLAIAEAVAHGFAMAIGAALNYIAHSRITFC